MQHQPTIPLPKIQIVLPPITRTTIPLPKIQIVLPPITRTTIPLPKIHIVLPPITRTTIRIKSQHSYYHLVQTSLHLYHSHEFNYITTKSKFISNYIFLLMNLPCPILSSHTTPFSIITSPLEIVITGHPCKI
jgi:hypothetical protein